MLVPRVRQPRRRVDGVLLLDKPPGLSSNAALQRAKRMFAAEKAGHTGTLDPLASGLLPICLGEATKFAQALLDARKSYLATVRFGIATTTGDAEGEVIAECPVAFAQSDLAGALPRFLGTIAQLPPRHSALKFQGRSYYEYARAGIEIPRAPRQVEIDAITLVDWVPPVATLRIACGKGTYIRALAEDLAREVGCCAHLATLRRVATGPFVLADAVGLDALETMDAAHRDALLLPIDAPLAGMQSLGIDADTARALVHGRVAPVQGSLPGRYRCFDPDGRFLGVVEADAAGVRAVRLVRAVARSG